MPTSIPGVTDYSSQAASNSSSSGSSTSSSSNSSLPGVDAKTFLNLLVAQLKYQDPSNPQDPTQFMSQTAQMYSVQALDAIQNEVTASAAAEGTMATASMIGKQVTATADDGTVVKGVVSGVSVGTNGPMLQIGTQTAPLSGVTQISAAPATSATTTSAVTT